MVWIKVSIGVWIEFCLGLVLGVGLELGPG
jgi:hypothetical protein